MSSATNNDLSVHGRFRQMNLSVGMDSNNLLLTWLEKHNKVFYGFAGGKWLSKDENANDSLHKIVDNFTGDHMCDVYVSNNDLPSRSFYKKSSASEECSAASRCKTLFKVAKTIEKYQQLFAAVESVSTGKNLSKVKSRDIPNVIESFNYNASCALELHVKSKSEVWFPIGPVCVIAEEYNNPSLSLSLRVASLLAAGNSILVVADVKSCLSAALLAEICVEAGVPADVFNVIPINLQSPKALEFIKNVSAFFSKVLYTGSIDKGILYKANTSLPFDVLVPRRPVVIIYENVDLYSAAEGVLEAFFCHDTRCQSGGCKLMLQESIAEAFLKILKEMFASIEVGRNLCKADLSCIVTYDQKKELEQCLKEAENYIKIYRKSNVANLGYTYMHPTLITDVHPGFKLVHEELGGPLLVAVIFRTEKESLAMFNCDNKGSPVSIWTDKISVALEVSRKLKSGTVWVNSQNIVNASSAFSGIYSSGNSVTGGQDAFFSHLKTSLELLPELKIKQMVEASPIPEIQSNRKEYKLYIGGAYKRSESGKALFRTNEIIYLGAGADVQNAVSSALTAQPKWENKSKHERRQILLSIVEIMEKRKQEFINTLNEETGDSSQAETKFSTVLEILYYWAGHIDSYNCETQEIAKETIVMQYRNPLGVIGIACSQDETLTFLSFVSLIAPAIAFGNAVVAVVMDSLSVLKMCEIFYLSGVPGGVINVISGPPELVLDLGKNRDVNAVWITYHSDIFKVSHFAQRVFDAYGVWKDFNEAKILKCVMSSTFIKTIFLPSGEIFAN